MASSFYAFLVLFLWNFLSDSQAFDCNKHVCEDNPEFTPSTLVVKYGDPAFATCEACKKGCRSDVFDIEKSEGIVLKDGETKLTWNVTHITQWDKDPYCFNNLNGTFCCTTLDVTVYQPPQEVSIGFVSHTGPLMEGGRYTLQCAVQDVAPIKNLVVTFYKGQMTLDPQQFLTDQRTPVNKSFFLSLTAKEEFNGEEFWCEATLELGPGGPKPPPVVKSQRLTATVHYGPKLDTSANQTSVTVNEGETLQLNCSAVGNPEPSYTWILPFSNNISHESVYMVKSVSSEHEGNYICSVSNIVREEKITFNVKVKSHKINLLIPILVSVAVVILIIITISVVYQHLKNKRTGNYNLKDVFRFRSRHFLVPAE
ncbi:vascular cell adhesion protein 1-like [Menidia menidia]